MAQNNQSQVGVRCKIGGSTTTVDTEAQCAELGGTVVKPPGGGGKVCGGCGAAMAKVAQSLGWSGGDLVEVSRSFLELAVRATSSGKKLFKALAKVDEDFGAAVTNNPRVLGAVIPSLALGSEFVRLMSQAPGKATDSLVFPRVTQRHFKKTIVELKKGNDDKSFQTALTFLEGEFAGWSKKSVSDLRKMYLGAPSKAASR